MRKTTVYIYILLDKPEAKLYFFLQKLKNNRLIVVYIYKVSSHTLSWVVCSWWWLTQHRTWWLCSWSWFCFWRRQFVGGPAGAAAASAAAAAKCGAMIMAMWVMSVERRWSVIERVGNPAASAACFVRTPGVGTVIRNDVWCLTEVDNEDKDHRWNLRDVFTGWTDRKASG